MVVIAKSRARIARECGALALLVLLAAMPARAEQALPTLPVDREARFVGVETCGSSECHASPEAWRNATVSMKERLIWQAHDKHAKAFTSLTSDAGRAIAKKLGIDDASQAPQCLTCHTTYVPVAQRGPKFSLENGVGCESCHGPGGQFLSTHVQPTAQHASNVKAGMYPTDQAAPRAALCLSCHQGDDKRMLGHTLYGAGHPRLRFELDTYGTLQPYHFLPDADYKRRKPMASHLELWAAGQLHAAERLLTQVKSAHAQGMFPELANYDCQTCHRPIAVDADHKPRAGVAPGALSLNDAPLVVLRALASLAAPAELAALRDDSHALQGALADTARRDQIIEKLKARVAMLANAMQARAEQSGDLAAVTRALFAEARAEQPLAYGAAESLAMALATLIAADYEQQGLSADQYQRASHALDGVYAAVGDERSYRAKTFVAALDELAATVAK
ncbi:MAG: hypothetical protein IT492_09405 [Gammaproteobacteria bacterium]|nr:hypothetical protein [Gammaproteobacteria bacterium]